MYSVVGNIGNLSKLETLLRNAKASFEKELNQGFQVKISIGIALLAEEKSYEELLEVGSCSLGKLRQGRKTYNLPHNNMKFNISIVLETLQLFIQSPKWSPGGLTIERYKVWKSHMNGKLLLSMLVLNTGLKNYGKMIY